LSENQIIKVVMNADRDSDIGIFPAAATLFFLYESSVIYD